MHNKEEIHNVLDLVREQIEEPEYINYGGCGLFAKLITERIKGLHLYRVLYYHHDYVDWYYDVNKYDVEYSGLNHVILRSNGGEFFDSDGFIQNDYEVVNRLNPTHPDLLDVNKHIIFRITKQELNKRLSTGRWNPTFEAQIGSRKLIETIKFSY